jgi:citrate lyase gamma subunit
MEILKGACAGTIDSSDAHVEIEPNSELNIAVNPKMQS